MDSSTKPRRRRVRLRDYDYTSSGYYFVTICTCDRRCLFGEVVDGLMHLNEVGTTVQEYWCAIASQCLTVALDQYVVMPNHLHGIVRLNGVVVEEEKGAMNRTPTDGSAVGAQFIAPSLGEVVRAFKARCTFVLRKAFLVEGSLWQRNYYEHVIRSDASLRAIREYVANNPMHWHLDRENPDRVR